MGLVPEPPAAPGAHAVLMLTIPRGGPSPDLTPKLQSHPRSRGFHSPLGVLVIVSHLLCLILSSDLPLPPNGSTPRFPTSAKGNSTFPGGQVSPWSYLDFPFSFATDMQSIRKPCGFHVGPALFSPPALLQPSAKHPLPALGTAAAPNWSPRLRACPPLLFDSQHGSQSNPTEEQVKQRTSGK